MKSPIEQKMINSLKISFALLLLFGCKGVDKDEPVPVLPDSVFNKVKLTDLKANPISLKEYNGKTIFLNFWATWCKPCKEEMPSIEKAQNILQNEKIVFLLASSESAEEIEEFKANHNYKFKYIRIENSEELNIQALPTTFIFNPEGKLVFSESGFRKWDEKNNIDILLKMANKDD